MFPGVDGFHWTFGHVLFLVLFFGVALMIAATMVSVLMRVAGDFRRGRAPALIWSGEFADLPEPERHCRHELAGRVEHRICPNAFDCRHCPDYGRFAVLPATTAAHTFGLSYPADRYYHRGHAWVRPEADGMLTIGLDDLAAHMIGRPDAVYLPASQTPLSLNEPAWRMRKNGYEIEVRAPIEGTVVETAGPEGSWYLKVKPQGTPDLRHLLRGPEVSGWLSREIDRLQLQLTEGGNAPSLADGGILIYGMMDALPRVDWEPALAAAFLEA